MKWYLRIVAGTQCLYTQGPPPFQRDFGTSTGHRGRWASHEEVQRIGDFVLGEIGRGNLEFLNTYWRSGTTKPLQGMGYWEVLSVVSQRHHRWHGGSISTCTSRNREGGAHIRCLTWLMNTWSTTLRNGYEHSRSLFYILLVLNGILYNHI